MNSPAQSPARNAFRSPVSTPARNNASSTAHSLSPENTAIANHALQSAFPGMQFHNLFEGLHALFHIGQVVITGSAAKAIHAQLNQGRYQTPFRAPNDIDVIVNTHRLSSAPLAQSSLLSQFGLRMPDASKPHILEYSSGEKTVKIDLIASDLQMVREEFDACETHGSVAISSLPSLQRMDRSRLRSGEGNSGQIRSDLRYFDTPAHHETGNTRPRAPETPPRIVRRRTS